MTKPWHLLIPTRGASIVDDLLQARALNDSVTERFHDSFLLNDMQVAVTRIRAALAKKERIHVFGDYDADGITSVAVLLRGLRSLGAEPTWRLPHRVEDGYGLRPEHVQDAVAKGAQLLITADNGTSAMPALEEAVRLGIDVIVVDHHTQTDDHPPVLALLNPKQIGSNYPFQGLAAVGVAIKLLHALGCKNVVELLDLAALGTVADMAPMRGENRPLVKKGLEQLQKTRWPGLRALIRVSAKGRMGPLNTRTLGWQLGPRINAAGRLGHPKEALMLLMEDNREEALRRAKALESVNKRRRTLQDEAVDDALKALAQSEELPSIVVVVGEQWHLGVVGLIAGRLSQELNKPCIVLTRVLGGGVIKGSARSVPGFDITEAIGRQRQLLVEFGGHREAAGLTLHEDHLEAFKEAVTKYAAAHLSKDREPAVEVDLEVSMGELSLELVALLRQLEPFGVGNPEPVFLLKAVRLERIFAMSKGKHHRLSLSDGSRKVEAVWWRSEKEAASLKYGDMLDVAGSVEINEWNGKTSLQFVVQDLRPAADLIVTPLEPGVNEGLS